jgi:transcriptional regulator with XRE-family HTH domain
MPADNPPIFDNKIYRFICENINPVKDLLKISYLYLERGVVGVWLLLLYGAAIWLVLATLVSFHFQADTAADTSEDDILNAINVQNLRADLEWSLQDDQWALDDIKYEIESLTRQKDTGLPNDPEVQKEISQDILRQESERRTIQSKSKETKLELEKIKGNSIFSGDESAKRLLELAGDFRYMRKWGFDEMALMPSQLLVLILTISMGAFGSVIHLTWEFFDKAERRRLSWYIFRPFLGAVLAFAMFILLKSGQMVVTNAAGVGSGSVDLNPYFISFLAIVSGILSEQAYTKITVAGTQIFNPPEKERWIRESVAKEAMESRNLKLEELGAFLGVPRKQTVQAWIDGENQLSERQQEIVSAWLGVSSRDLFTDQPPPSEKPEVSDQAAALEEPVEPDQDTTLPDPAAS